MSAFTVSGVEFVAKGVSPYLSTLSRVDAAQQKLGGSVTGVTERFANAQTSAGRFSTALSNIGQIASGIIVAQVFTRITDAVGSAVSAGFSFNNALEQAGAKINAFTKDAGATEKILADVRREAAATPFEFQAMADATAGLLPAAKQAQVGIMDLLRDAEVLAASNPAEGLTGAAFALREAVSGDFTSVIERFNLPRSMINQLKAEGLPALEIVRKAMGEMGYDMDLVSALANTAEGRWSTFKDTLVNVAGTVTKPIFDTWSSGLGTVNEWLTQNEPMLTEMGNILANQVATAITTVTTKATELFTAFQAGGVKGLAGALGIPPETYDTIVNISTKIGEILTTIASYGGFGLAGILVVDPAARETTITFLSDLWTWLKTNIPQAITTVSDLWNNKLKPGFTQIGETINAQLLPALNNLFAAFSSGTGGTQTLADLWQNTLKPALFAVGDFVINSLFPAWVKLEQFLIGGLAIAINLLADYWRTILFPAISAVATFVKDTVIPALSDLWAWLGPKIGDAIKGMSDLWTGTLQPALLAVNSYMSENIIPLLESLGNLFNAVVGKALEAFAGLWKNVLLPALTKVGNFLKDTLSPVFAEIGKSVSEDVSPVLKDLGEVIFPLLQEGLDYVTEAIKTTISFFDSLAAKVNSFSLPPILQGHSPPPMANFMMDIANSTNAANDAVKGMMDSLASTKWGEIRAQVFNAVDDLQDAGYYMSRGFGQTTGEHIKRAFKRAFQESFQGILTGQVTGRDLEALTRHFAGAYADRVHGSFNTIVERTRQMSISLLREMQDELLSALPSLAGNLSGLAGQFGDFLKPEMDARAAMIKRLQEFMKDPQGGLFKFDWKDRLVGVDHVMMNQIQAQGQLNMLLREQANQEKLITEQKEAQQKLAFLQAQVDLIKIGKELGGNIFQGMTFGLHASTEDMLKATNAVVEAMIEQINTTLQIASPSRVMARIGHRVIEGMAQGLEGGRALLDRAIQSTPLLSGALMRPMAQPAYGGGGDTYTSYEFPMTVHTASTPQGVIRQYEVKRSMFAS